MSSTIFVPFEIFIISEIVPKNIFFAITFIYHKKRNKTIDQKVNEVKEETIC